MVGDDGQLPDVMVVQVWARRQVGECCTDIAAWLAQVGYRVGPGEVKEIASRHAQWLEAAWARWARRQGASTGSALPP
jgi:hypothetical protein